MVTLRPGESIQAAIDAAEAGAVICLARGVWKESIVVDRPLTLLGRGTQRTVIQASQAFQPVIAVSDQRAEPAIVKLEGLTISGAGASSGLAVTGSAVVEVENCEFSGLLYGIRADDSAHLTVIDSSVHKNRQLGVVLSGLAQASISGSRISGNIGPGVWLSDHTEATFLRCEISVNRGHGLWLRDKAMVSLNDCSIARNEGHGLWLTASSEARLLSTHISGNWDQGIRAEASAEVELTKSYVLSNWHGIEARDRAVATIVDSTVSGNRFDGVKVQNSARIAASESVISDNRRGVWIAGRADAEITDCFIEQNLGYGIFSWSSGDVRGRNNRLRANGIDLGGNLPGELRVPSSEPREAAIVWPDARYAALQEAVDALLPGGALIILPGRYAAGLTIGKKLRIEAGPGEVTLRAESPDVPVFSLVDGADLHVVGVTISGGSEGLLVSAGARVTLDGCAVSENADGINLSFASWAQINNCSIAANERSGIFAGGGAEATIIQCTVSNNDGYGIAATDSAQVTVTDSTVVHNGLDGGIVVWGSCELILEANTIIDNRGFGVATFQRPCFTASPWVFQGRISGSSNTVGGNRRGDFCPSELEFLSTAEGGVMDLRPSHSE